MNFVPKSSPSNMSTSPPPPQEVDFNLEVNSIDCVRINFTQSISPFFVNHICSTIKKQPMPSTDHSNTHRVTINFGNVPEDGSSVVAFCHEVAYHQTYFSTLDETSRAIFMFNTFPRNCFTYCDENSDRKMSKDIDIG